MNATVIITTKNRREDLARAVASALAQTARTEVIVIDDGSTDGTSELVGREFPSVKLHRSEKSLGLIVQRNRGARLATNSILFSIDDDAVFSSSTIIEATLREFNSPRVGAVAIPFVNINQSQAILQKAPQPEGIYADYTYIGTAHALRRDLFLELGGYREILIHQGEEEDYCLRMLNAGYITRAGNAEPIHHFESPRRSWQRMDYYGARNKVLYAWHNVPWPYLCLHLPATTMLALAQTWRPSRFLTRLRGVLDAYFTTGSGRATRQPVAGHSYQLSRKLKREGSVPLPQIEACLQRLQK